jgi:hypothetical protein
MDYIGIAEQTIAERYPLLIYSPPPPFGIPAGAILGTWAISVPGKMRYILDRTKELAPGVMPSDLTRSWLHDAYNLPIKQRKEQVQAECYPHPQKALIGHYGECAYVDIRKAYIKILELGYNMDYLKGQYLGVNFQPVPEQVQNNKLSYAVAVSMSNSILSQIQIMGHEGPFTSSHFNIYSNPSLYHFASDTLASIASECLRIFGDRIKYVNTDGYIVELKDVEALQRVIKSWGFDSRVKFQGETWIWGVGSWRVGGERTKRKDPNPSNFLSPMPDKNESLWLKKRVSRLLDESLYRLGTT